MTILDSEEKRAWRERVCAAVEGYLVLDLPELALEELNSLPESQKLHPAVLAARVAVHMHLKDWKRALSFALKGRRLSPDTGSFYFHAAYCLHELGLTLEAKKSLEAAPSSLRQDPLYHYNLGCYLNVLGQKAEARLSLNRAFKLDEKLREHARQDPDLRSLWAVL